MMHRSISGLLFGWLLVAQTALPQTIVVISAFPPQLKQHLELTDAQVTSILTENTALGNFESQKTQRQIQVQIELAQETAKATVDPMALGLRHMEIESIRRELQAEAERTAARVQNLLTPAQKTKLEALRAAMALQGVICEAQGVNLLAGATAPNFVRSPFPGNIVPANRWFNTPSFFPAAYPSCGGAGRIGGASFTRAGGTE